jgi:protein required for attachment to host cells
MARTWIVVADAANARVFEGEPGGGLVEAVDFVHPASRRRASVLTDDKQGHVERNPGGGRASSGYSPRTDPHEKEEARFAAELADAIEAAAVDGRCGALVVLAAPHFLGELRGRLGPAATRILRASEALDLTHLPQADLIERLAPYLRHG